MPTITATAFNTPAYVLLELDWTDQPTVQFVSVVRRNTVTGEEVTLRPYVFYDDTGAIALSCGTAILWDTEPPLNVPLEYCTYASAVQTAINSNTGFETGLAPWTATGGAAVQSGLFFHTGAFSAQLTPTGGIASSYIADTTAYPLQQGVETTVSAWFFTPQGWNAAYTQMQIRYDDGLLETFTSHITPIRAASAWQLVTFTFTPARAATSQFIRAGATGLPPNTTLIYIDDVSVSQAQANAATACDTVTVTSDSVWLKSPLFPCSDIEIGLCSPEYGLDCETDSRVSYAGMADDERAANTALSMPANRKYPIPTSRIRRGPNSTLRLIAHDCEARDAIVLINEPGTPLLFQAPEDYCIPDRYLSVGTLTESRISVDQREDFRLMVLPYATVERPSGPANGFCGARIFDLCDIYTTWAALALSGLDWGDLLLGLGAYGPVNPPPAAARTWDSVAAEFTDWDDVEAGGTRTWDELRDGL